MLPWFLSPKGAFAPRFSRTLQFSGTTFLLCCTSHMISVSRLKLDSVHEKHNRSHGDSFVSSLTVRMARSTFPDLSRCVRNSISLHHLSIWQEYSMIAVFKLLIAWYRFGFFGRSPLGSEPCSLRLTFLSPGFSGGSPEVLRRKENPGQTLVNKMKRKHVSTIKF